MAIPGMKWSRDRWRHVTLKGRIRDPNTLRAQYLKNCWRCYLATIASLLWGSYSDSFASCSSTFDVSTKASLGIRQYAHNIRCVITRIVNYESISGRVIQKKTKWNEIVTNLDIIHVHVLSSWPRRCHRQPAVTVGSRRCGLSKRLPPAGPATVVVIVAKKTMVQALVSCRLDYCDSVLRHLGKTDVPIAVGSERGHPSGYSYSPCLALCHPRLVSVILNIRKTVEIILVCLTTAAPVIFNWRLTNVLTN